MIVQPFSNLILAPFFLPFITALIILVLKPERQKTKRVVGLVSIAILIVTEIFLLRIVADGTILVSRLGNWPAPFGIALLADRLTVIMLLLASITAFAALLFSACDKNPEEGGERPYFQALYQFLLVGINMSFLTADLFNLFVCYELMLAASYCLLILGGKKNQLSAGFHYIAINLINSTLFLIGLGLLYGVMGTLNMADLALKIGQLEGHSLLIVHCVSILLLIVFSLKAGLVPLFFWLPDSYTTPSITTSTLFAGIMTKVGVYSILRVFTLVFGGPDSYAAHWILPLATLTMLIGVLGAIVQVNFRRLLSFHIISQVGYMVMGIGLFTPLGIAGGISYIIHHIMVKSGLFLCGGIAKRLTGTENLREMAGLSKAPLYSGLFFIAGLSLAGLPPFSGFFSKFLVIRAGLESREFLVVGVSLVAGLLTLFSMMKIWTMAFWGKPKPERFKIKIPAVFILATVILVSFSITLGIFTGPIYEFVQAAAHQLLNPTLYIEAVLT